MEKKVVKKRKHFSVASEYKMCLSFLKDSREYIYATFLIFLIFAVCGFFFQDIIQSAFKTLFNLDLNLEILTYLKRLILQTEGMSYQQLMGFIFLNNIQSSFFGMILGIFFGVFPIIALLINGYVLGFVAAMSVQTNGLWVLWRILPHGIFELPAVFISLGLGLRIGLHLFIIKKKYSFQELIVNSLRIFLLVIFPLLVVAALIEATLIAFIG
jgi:stage II sporulation protein M